MYFSGFSIEKHHTLFSFRWFCKRINNCIVEIAPLEIKNFVYVILLKILNFFYQLTLYVGLRFAK